MYTLPIFVAVLASNCIALNIQNKNVADINNANKIMDISNESEINNIKSFKNLALKRIRCQPLGEGCSNSAQLRCCAGLHCDTKLGKCRSGALLKIAEKSTFKNDEAEKYDEKTDADYINERNAKLVLLLDNMEKYMSKNENNNYPEDKYSTKRVDSIDDSNEKNDINYASYFGMYNKKSTINELGIFNCKHIGQSCRKKKCCSYVKCNKLLNRCLPK